MLKLLPLAMRSLRRRSQRRNLFTAMAVAAAILVFAVVAIVPYAMRIVVDRAGLSPRLVVYNRAGYMFGLPQYYSRQIAQLPGILAVSRMMRVPMVYDDPRKPFRAFAVDDNPEKLWPEYGFQGAAVEDFKKKKNAAMVGNVTMQYLGWHVGQIVQLRTQLYATTLSFQIVGTYDKGPEPTLFITRLDYLNEAIRQPLNVQLIWVRCATTHVADMLKASIDEMFRNSDAETETVNEQKHLSNYAAFFMPFVRVVEGLGVCAVLAIGLAVLNATAMSTRERRGEIAILRSLGFTGPEVIAAVLTENALVSAAGGIVGMSAAWLLLSAARGSVPALGPLLSFGLPYAALAGGLGLALLIGLVAGFAPALTAVRANISLALRHLR